MDFESIKGSDRWVIGKYSQIKDSYVKLKSGNQNGAQMNMHYRKYKWTKSDFRILSRFVKETYKKYANIFYVRNKLCMCVGIPSLSRKCGASGINEKNFGMLQFLLVTIHECSLQIP